MFKEYKTEIKNALKDFKNIKTVYKQIPNMLTLTRILAPFIIIPITLTSNLMVTIIISSIIASTDFFDGLVARKFNITSNLGKDLDALSDKVFASTLIIPLILQNPLYITNILLEILIGTSNLRAKIKNKKPKTIFVGKVKTALLSVNILIGYLNMIFSINPILLSIIFSSTVVLQIISAYKYIKINNNKNDNSNTIKEHDKFEIEDKDNNEKVNVLEKQNNYKKEIEKTITYKNDKTMESKVKIKKLEKKLRK